MKFEVRLFGGLEKSVTGATFGKPIDVEAPEGTTVAGVISMIGVREEEVFTILVNGVRAEIETLVRQGDRVAFFPPVGGG
ncbi:MAG: ThiS family protein [Pelotomaculum sp. PtaB.Bin104]|nr:MAG: ThiS family protein [Pelotomaculum sp. PtaB.Bin104]